MCTENETKGHLWNSSSGEVGIILQGRNTLIKDFYFKILNFYVLRIGKDIPLARNMPAQALVVGTTFMAIGHALGHKCNLERLGFPPLQVCLKFLEKHARG